MSLLEAAGDRVNPILVREVRQALRGRYFKISYAITLVLAVFIALTQLLLDASPDGGEFFVWMFGCLAAASFFWVPFFAFVSMGSEWEENTYDLLVLSNLRPHGIVYGKLLAAGVQTLLYFSAFGPFLVFAFLLQGVNLSEILLVLGGALVFSFCLSLLSIGISSLSTVKFVRVSLMTGLAGILLFATVGAIGFGSMIIQRWAGPREVLIALCVILSAAVCLAILFGELACVRLSHVEENRSTGLRFLTLLVLLVIFSWLGYGLSQMKAPEMLSGVTLVAVCVTALISLFFVSEFERLGRRVERAVPRNRFLALLAAPFLPGGGRGMLFFLLCCGLELLVPQLLSLKFDVDRVEWWQEGCVSVHQAVFFGIVFVGLPAALMSRWSNQVRRRILCRAFVLLFFAWSFFLPTLWLFLVRGVDDDNFRHAGNVFYVLERSWDHPSANFGVPMLWGIMVLAVCTIFLNLRRMIAGVREVMTASAKRRQERMQERMQDAAL